MNKPPAGISAHDYIEVMNKPPHGLFTHKIHGSHG